MSTPAYRQMSKSANSQTRKFAGLMVAVGLIAAVCVLVYTRVLIHTGPLGWDEATHALSGYRIARDLRAGDVGALIADTKGQLLYPATFSWMQGIFFFVFGTSTVNARLFSLVCFAFALLLMYVTATRLFPANGEVIGLAALALGVTGRYVLEIAATSMREMSLMLLIVLFLLAQIGIARTRRRRWYLLAGICAIAIMLDKYNYGVIVIAAALAIDVVDIILTRRAIATGQVSMPADAVSTPRWLWKAALREARLRRSLFFIYLPTAAAALLWYLVVFEGSPEMLMFSLASADVPFKYWWWTPRAWLYYPRALLRDMSLSPLTFSLSIIGFGAAFVGLFSAPVKRQRAMTPLLLTLGIAFGALTFHPHKFARFLIPFLPAFWLLSAFGLVEAWRWLRGKLSKRWKFAYLDAGAAILLALLVLPGAWGLYANQLRPTSYAGMAVDEKAEVIEGVLDFLRDNVDTARPAILIGTFAELSPHLIEWSFRTAALPYRISYEPANWPPGAGYYKVRLNEWLTEHRDWQVITVEVATDSPFYNLHDFAFYNEWKQDYVREMANRGDYEVRAARVFPKMGVAARIYEYRR